MYVLYGAKGCGSVVVEMLLELLGQKYRYVSASPWLEGPERDTLQRLNPLGQVPTLILPDGEVMTESLAIILTLLDRHPRNTLQPATQSLDRARFYRWMTYMATNIYALYGVADFPERWLEDITQHKPLRKAASNRLKARWKHLEASLNPDPWMLGNSLTALDLYVSMMSWWHPGRNWLSQECPKIYASIQHTDQHPVVASVLRRNYSMGG